MWDLLNRKGRADRPWSRRRRRNEQFVCTLILTEAVSAKLHQSEMGKAEKILQRNVFLFYKQTKNTFFSFSLIIALHFFSDFFPFSVKRSVMFTTWYKTSSWIGKKRHIHLHSLPFSLTSCHEIQSASSFDKDPAVKLKGSFLVADQLEETFFVQSVTQVLRKSDA